MTCLEHGFVAEVDAAFVVDLDNFDLELVADLDDVFDFLDAVVGELGDVAEAFFATFKKVKSRNIFSAVF